MAALAVVSEIEAVAPDAAAADTSTARLVRKRPACADADAGEADDDQMTAATCKRPAAAVKDELPADASGDDGFGTVVCTGKLKGKVGKGKPDGKAKRKAEGGKGAGAKTRSRKRRRWQVHAHVLVQHRRRRRLRVEIQTLL